MTNLSGNTCEAALAPVNIPVSIDNIDKSTSAHDEVDGSSLAPDIHSLALAPDNVDDSCLALENKGMAKSLCSTNCMMRVYESHLVIALVL